MVSQSLFFGATILIASYFQLAFNTSWYWSTLCFLIYSFGVLRFIKVTVLYHPLFNNMIMIFIMTFVSMIMMTYQQVK